MISALPAPFAQECMTSMRVWRTWNWVQRSGSLAWGPRPAAEFRIDDPEQVEKLARQIKLGIGGIPIAPWTGVNSTRRFSADQVAKGGDVFGALLYCRGCCVQYRFTLFWRAVVEKSAQIGVLKSMGTQDNSIMKVFVIEGWMVGGLGTCLGCPWDWGCVFFSRSWR
ncbi:MAG: FtsX-like permease family protein [Myxococcota bacterium]